MSTHMATKALVKNKLLAMVSFKGKKSNEFLKLKSNYADRNVHVVKVAKSYISL